MAPRNARGHAKSITGARGARGARRNHDEKDDENHQESVMGGGASAPGGNVGGAPPTTLGGAEFMQGVFTAIEQVMRNTVQTMQVLVRTAESWATTAMKAFLQLRPPMFKGEPDPLVAEDWLEQVTRALDTILVTEEDLRVLFASYQLQGDALQWWKTMEEVGVLGASDGEARADGDDAERLEGAGDGRGLELEELSLFEDELAAVAGLDVVALLREPAGLLGARLVLCRSPGLGFVPVADRQRLCIDSIMVKEEREKERSISLFVVLCCIFKRDSAVLSPFCALQFVMALKCHAQ
ncbi:pleckstrin homology (PH) domain superfamily protein [Actinidia rufa]|uniref:Pleckstrin homology (PH) domain superfamily protein n=1 Tax=Actinidia rufa TaxID=165716 RepID=A0A7J0FSD1_9ERIC|nr:pleckstrin homology (PH) domain superfamily protein [Actinidia rufa]